ncbi:MULTISPECIES: serine hydrolase [Flavobacteriaceae]|uniref:serine hydrolase domain-containing protein n=1 Tax=Flavobacteriaceae TaxID=49546 RepID=UPI001491C4F0|nr:MULTISPECIES: serine hydrolase domain-containing protein [Allomuricauda]MDC6366970.1 serine hydrolase [Muricauda sp. AC10]
MKLRTVNILIFLILLGSIACEPEYQFMSIDDTEGCDQVSTTDASHPKAITLQETLDEYTAKGIPGLSVFVQTADGQVWTGASGYSRIEDNLPMTPCNKIYTASIGKTFCAVSVLLLAQDGLVDLDDAISQHIPEEILQGFTHTDIITVRQLLNHTSGLTNLDWNTKFISDVFNDPFEITTDDLLEYERGEGSLFEPGTDFNYSSTGYELLAALVEAKTGNHAAFYTERIFKPLGLTETYYKNEASYPTPTSLVNGYWDRFDTEQLENISDVNNHLTSIFTGSDGLITTPQDLYTFLKAIGNEGFLSESIKTEMLDFVTTGGSTYIGYGLGLWQIKTDYGIAYGHDGDAIGAGADMWYFPEKDTYIIVATNLGTVLSDTKLSILYNDDFLDAILKVVME